MLSQPLELKHRQIVVLSDKHFRSPLKLSSAEFWAAVHEPFLSLMSCSM